VERPLHAITAIGALTHNALEPACGAGLVGQSLIGLPRATALWTGAGTAWLRVARAPSERGDRAMAAAAGASVAGVLVHVAIGRVALRRGLPVLTEVERLPHAVLPAYNALLYVWGLAALAALVAETPRRARRWALPGLLSFFPLAAAARAQLEWLAVEANTNPQWWNRAFQR
jgi:hypothetical protein